MFRAQGASCWKFFVVLFRCSSRYFKGFYKTGKWPYSWCLLVASVWSCVRRFKAALRRFLLGDEERPGGQWSRCFALPGRIPSPLFLISDLLNFLVQPEHRERHRFSPFLLGRWQMLSLADSQNTSNYATAAPLGPSFLAPETHPRLQRIPAPSSVFPASP